MNVFINDIANREVWPILIKNEGKSFYTLYYYTSNDDAILHDNLSILYFDSYNDLKSFCINNALVIMDDFQVFDLDIPTVSPTDYRMVLNNWNLLNTISNIFGMYFEGNDRKYDSVYDLLFRCCTSIENLPKQITFKEKINKSIFKVFERKNRLLAGFVHLEITGD